VWDYGPLGVELQRNVKEAWWRSMVHERDDIEGLDAAILMHPRVWEASGHVPASPTRWSTARTCKARFRADQMEMHVSAQAEPQAGRARECELTEPRLFNLMFKTFMGPVEDAAAVVYLRPETAQGSYVNFQNVRDGRAAAGAVRHRADRQGVPQRDHAGQLHLPDARVRADGDAVLRGAGHGRRVVRVLEGAAHGVVQSLGIRAEKLRFDEHGPDALAHYAKKAFDIQYEFPFGWQEFEGVHNRTDFDLRRHQEYSGKKLEYVDPSTATSATCRT
jgi:glycyl-tRNA synthetase